MTAHHKPDQSFDSIAEKFNRNIYGTSKGKLRHELLLHYLQQLPELNSGPLRVLDVGGGTGVMSKAMLDLGHDVTLNDLSADTLALAQQLCGDSANLILHQGPLQSLSELGQRFDLVLCHAVLEWLRAPFAVLPLLADLCKPGGYLSLSFFNKDAQKFGNLLYGNFDYVQADLKVKKTVRLNPSQPLYPHEVLAHIEPLPLKIVHKAGIRCIHDYVRERSLQQREYAAIKAAEVRFGVQHPYLWLGKYFHLIAQRLDH